jgi:hypothetical protein
VRAFGAEFIVEGGREEGKMWFILFSLFVSGNLGLVRAR